MVAVIALSLGLGPDLAANWSCLMSSMANCAVDCMWMVCCVIGLCDVAGK